MRKMFLFPQFPCPEKTRRASLLVILIWTNSLLGILSLLGMMVTQPEIRPTAITNLCVLATMALALFAIARRGWVNAAAWLLIGVDVGMTTLRALHAGGIHSPGVMLFFVYALMAGLVLGEAAGFATAGACALIGLGLVLAELHNMLPSQTLHYNSFTYWWISCFYMGLVVYLLRLAMQDLNRALARAEAELTDRRRTEQHLNVALEAALIGVWDGDVTSSRFKLDARAAAMFGVTRGDDGCIDIADWRKIVHPEDLPALTRIVEEQIGHQPMTKFEYRVIWPSGAIRHIEAISAPIADASGKVVSHVGTLMDVTERKLAEAERDDHERKRGSLEHQLLQAQKREAVGTLASGIAHDFNNILGAIRGFADLLKDDLEKGSQARRFAERISATCHRGKDIVNQILTFARTGSQPQASIELAMVLHECEAMLTDTITTRAALHFSYAPRHVHVTANAGQIVQLVTNLSVNAAESFGDRRGAIAVLLELPSADDIAGVARAPRHAFNHCIGRIDEGVSYARIHVRDNGGGIAPDVLQQIFAPSSQPRAGSAARAWACRCARASSKAMAASAMWKPSRDAAPAFTSICPPPRRRAPRLLRISKPRRMCAAPNASWWSRTRPTSPTA